MVYKHSKMTTKDVTYKWHKENQIDPQMQVLLGVITEMFETWPYPLSRFNQLLALLCLTFS